MNSQNYHQMSETALIFSLNDHLLHSYSKLYKFAHSMDFLWLFHEKDCLLWAGL